MDGRQARFKVYVKSGNATYRSILELDGTNQTARQALDQIQTWMAGNVRALVDNGQLEEAGQLNQETEQAINTLSAMSANDNFATVVLRDRGVYFLNQNSRFFSSLREREYPYWAIFAIASGARDPSPEHAGSKS